MNFKTEQIDLSFERFAVSFMIQMRELIGLRDARAATLHVQQRLHEAAEQFAITLTLPSKVLQKNRVCASWPATLWDHVKSKLGMKHARMELRASEIVTFPHLDLPARLSDGMRVHFTTVIERRAGR